MGELRNMPSPAYFRRQADICLRLSLVATDPELATRLLAMAEDYKAKAGLAGEDGEPDAIVPDLVAAQGQPDREIDPG
jgi:hypothetical protein